MLGGLKLLGALTWFKVAGWFKVVGWFKVAGWFKVPGWSPYYSVPVRSTSKFYNSLKIGIIFFIFMNGE